MQSLKQAWHKIRLRHSPRHVSCETISVCGMGFLSGRVTKVIAPKRQEGRQGLDRVLLDAGEKGLHVLEAPEPLSELPPRVSAALAPHSASNLILYDPPSPYRFSTTSESDLMRRDKHQVRNAQSTCQMCRSALLTHTHHKHSSFGAVVVFLSFFDTFTLAMPLAALRAALGAALFLFAVGAY